MSDLYKKKRGILMIACESTHANATKMGLECWMRPLTTLERYDFAKAELKAFDARYGNRFLGDESDKAKPYEKRRMKLQDVVSDAYYDCVQEMGERLRQMAI